MGGFSISVWKRLSFVTRKSQKTSALQQNFKANPLRIENQSLIVLSNSLTYCFTLPLAMELIVLDISVAVGVGGRGSSGHAQVGKGRRGRRGKDKIVILSFIVGIGGLGKILVTWNTLEVAKEWISCGASTVVWFMDLDIDNIGFISHKEI
ncbi:hypothetical protein L6452_22873 [Arctium lappa]|uniref:Uncharacterized protein n=1 Tax=Arctium lappa TaxID=4217 RepID=A0ACB9B1Y2_ARCLA|nr:hypothetical protein L6452_22873 [Arctium lappa]